MVDRGGGLRKKGANFAPETIIGGGGGRGANTRVKNIGGTISR